MSAASFFFNDTATTEIYTLSLHDALPILPFSPRIARVATSKYRLSISTIWPGVDRSEKAVKPRRSAKSDVTSTTRSEEHTSELQSRQYLVCRLLLEKKQTHYSHVRHNSIP